jgi:hypothetical protein
MSVVKDLSGQKFGCSLVQSYVSKSSPSGKQGRWSCLNDCGKIQLKATCDLKKHTCACGKKNAISKSRTTHGMSSSSEHNSWVGMKTRCTNPNNDRWKFYGGRGIKVCERWFNSFANFMADMGPKPSPVHSLDRYPDRDGDYEPANCRWATPLEQVRNRSCTRIFTFNGETLSAAEWGRRLGGTAMLVTHRLSRGWSYETAFTTLAKNNK